MKEKITKWYKLGLWTEEMVQKAVEKNILTENEYNEIIKNTEE